MISIDLGGRVRLFDGPANRLEVHELWRVCAGDQPLNVVGRPRYIGDRFGATYVYEMRPGVTYNILKPEAKGRTITRFIAATVMLDHDGKAWVGEPTNRFPVRKGDPTAWNRILDFDLDEGT